MQLVSMEVNQLGSADRTQVGSLTAGLNAICGRRGSGKSSLVAWLRSLIQPQDSRASQNSSNHPAMQASGRLTLRVGDGEYQLERHQRAGRTSSKILRRATAAWNGNGRTNGHSQTNGHSHTNGHAHTHTNGHTNGHSHADLGSRAGDHWNDLAGRLGAGAAASGELLTNLQQAAFDRLAAIPSDSQATFHLWDVARDLQLEHETSRHQPVDERSMLVQREQELMAQLQPLEGVAATREGLLARRRQLESDLDRARRQSGGQHYAPATDEHHRQSDRLSALDRDCEKLRTHIAELDAAILRLRDTQTIDTKQNTYRERLQALDAQLARWRNTLTEIRAHRERLEASATDAHLEGQLGEQFTPINQATPRLALRSLEAQIVEARRHFDSLIEGVERYRDDRSRDAHDVRQELPQTLRLMQRELHEVCQQLSRHESLSTNRAMQDQILQLSRCESEMRLAVERLIAERGELLRTIATACHLSVDQVSLAYSDSCRCADHPHLDAWLGAVANGPMAGQLLSQQAHIRPEYFDELADLESRRSHAIVQLESAQRDRQDTDSRLRHLGVKPLANGSYDRVEADLLRELDLVNEDILRLETRDRLRVDLVDVRRRLQHLPYATENAQSLRARYMRHLSGLTGQPIDRTSQAVFRDQLHRDALAPSRYSYERSPLNGAAHASRELDTSYGVDPMRRYEPVRGQYIAEQTSLASADSRLARLEEVALRLAIADVLAARGHQVPVILDETLDGLHGPHVLTAVRYLAGHADVARQQIVLMTDDHELADTVKSVRGNVVTVVGSHAVATARPEPAHIDYDVNRQLTALANDFESAKWYEPEWTPPVVRTEPKKRWILSERSDIQEVPSIGNTFASRLRAIGIHRVGDLLDVDADWVANNLRLANVDAELVSAWQNESRLLCGMPQLRPFDARVLAGAGVRDPRQLTEMDPSRLLERVENFLASERGKHIMRSGSSHELSRLTAWVASAKRGTGSRRSAADRQESHSGFERRTHSEPQASDRRPMAHRVDDAQPSVPTYHIVERDDAVEELDQNERVTRRRDRDSNRDRDRGERGERSEHGQSPARKQPRAARSTNGSAKSNGDAGLKFYLEQSSPVVDAPSIGASMAHSLEEVGIVTVDDLLSVNPEDLAQDLGQPRVTGAVIRAWQEQARLVCRIPNLRGHDAQILVACGVTTPEALCRLEPTALLAQSTAFATSTQGQRVLRGSQAPDLDEVKQWISWAANSRALLAA